MLDQKRNVITDRLISALWVPILAIIATAAIVVSIGELLLALAKGKPELGDVREPFSVLVALAIAAIVLLGAMLLSRTGRSSGS